MRKTHKAIATILTAIMSVTIFTCTAMASEVVSQETVKEVQQALNEAGFDCGTPDGIAGKGTAAAVSAYQEANGLPVDGQISEELLTSLGIGTTISEDPAADISTTDNAASSGDEFSENAYDGEWIPVSDIYEIYLPSGMTLADDKELEELSLTASGGVDTYLFSAKAENGMTINFHCTMSDAFDFSQSEQTGIKSIQDFWDYLKEQISSFSQPGSINGIEGLYYDNISPDDGSTNPTYFWFSEDALNFLEFRNCGDESGIEFARTIMESLRRAEESTTETIVETEKPEESETGADLKVEAQTETGNAAVASEPETELYEINANGQYDGVTDEGHHFKWFSCMKFIFYMKDGLMYEIGPYNGELVFGKLNDDMSFDETTVSYLSADPEVLRKYAQLAYEVFGELVLFEKGFESNYIHKDSTEPEAEYIEFDTSDGDHLRWNDYNKLVYVYNADNVYQFSLLHGDLVFGKLNEDGETFKWYTSLTELETFPEIMSSAMDFMILECLVRAAEDSK